MLLHHIPLVAATKSGRNHAIVVPHSTALSFVVKSSRYTLADSLGHALNGDMQVQIAPGTKPAAIQIRIAGDRP